MGNKNYRSAFAITIFAIWAISFLLSHVTPKFFNLNWIVLVISGIYLLAGWYFFKGYFPGGSGFILFIFGYIYSSIITASVFVSFEWPFANSLVILTPFWLVLLLILLIVFWKKIPKEGLLKFLVESFLLLILVIFLIIQI